MGKTITQARIEEMEEKGYKLAGRSRGLYTFRKGSNLIRELERLGLTKSTCEVRTGIHIGTSMELLIFVKRKNE